MEKFKNVMHNFKTKTRILALTSLLCVFMLIIGSLGTFGIAIIKTNTDYLMDSVLVRKEIGLKMDVNIQMLRTVFNKMVVQSEFYDDDEKTQEEYDEAQEYISILKDYIESYKLNMDKDTTITAEAKENLLNELTIVENGIKEFETLFDEGLDAAINDKEDIVDKNYQQIQVIAGSLNENIDILNALIDERADLLTEENTALTRKTLVLVIVVFIIAFILSTFFSLMLAGDIANPIINLSKASLRIAKGDFDVNVSSNARDEVGELSNNFATLVDTFKNLVSDLDDAINLAAVEGKRDVSIDTSKYEGEYATLANKINEMFETTVLELGSCRKAAEAYANGHFDVTCKRFPGEKSIIHERFDLLQSNLKDVTAAINTFINGINEGDLSVQVDASKFDGDWASLIQALNLLIKHVASPIKETENALNEINNGNLGVKINADKYNGQFKEMLLTIQNTTDVLSGYIHEISTVLNTMAHQNLDVTIEHDYVGDFAPIKISLNLIVDNFNHLIKEIMVSSDQVAIGSQAIADSSSTLAQGASEQSTSIEQLNETIGAISENTQKNMENVLKASQLADDAKGSAEQVTNEMRQLLDAMKEINEASNNISNIIKAIDDIAFQTNILSLNAAVEAARAGEHGKGFAVVAEEVRNLAARSQTSAKETADIIATSLEKVAHGSEIVDRTAETVKTISAQIDQVSAIAAKVADDSTEQEKSIGEINIGINQIATVVANNTATSEESAAASEELASQSAVFKESVSKFTLRA